MGEISSASAPDHRAGGPTQQDAVRQYRRATPMRCVAPTASRYMFHVEAAELDVREARVRPALPPSDGHGEGEEVVLADGGLCVRP